MGVTRGPEGREGQTGREGVHGREGLPGTEGKTGQTGPRGPSGTRITWELRVAFLIVTLIFFLTCAGFAWVVMKVNDRPTRIESCKATYEGVRDVVQPLFLTSPQTRIQEVNLTEFNQTVDRLKNNCSKQISKEDN